MAYMDLSKRVFKTDQVIKGVIPTGDDQCRFDYNILEAVIKEVVKNSLQDENAKMDESNETGICPTFVVATPGLNADGPPSVLRSYKCKGANPSQCAIWEAGRATSAAPLFFKPIHINTPPPGLTFVDGGLGHNNPSEVALQEAQRLWPTAKQFCLVSVGTGRQRSVKLSMPVAPAVTAPPEDESHGRSSIIPSWISIPGWRTATRLPAGVYNLKRIAEVCAQLVTGSEAVHQRVLRACLSNHSNMCFRYYRFNVEHDMEDVQLQEYEKINDIAAHTRRYMDEGEGEMKRDQCVADLVRLQA